MSKAVYSAEITQLHPLFSEMFPFRAEIRLNGQYVKANIFMTKWGARYWAKKTIRKRKNNLLRAEFEPKIIDSWKDEG